MANNIIYKKLQLVCSNLGGFTARSYREALQKLTPLLIKYKLVLTFSEEYQEPNIINCTATLTDGSESTQMTKVRSFEIMSAAPGEFEYLVLRARLLAITAMFAIKTPEDQQSEAVQETEEQDIGGNT